MKDVMLDLLFGLINIIPEKVDITLNTFNLSLINPRRLERVMFEQYCQYRVRFKPRPGLTYKTTCEVLVGKELVVDVAWKMNDGDPVLYQGEWALGPYRRHQPTRDLFEEANITWIASGDVELIGQYEALDEHQ